MRSAGAMSVPPAPSAECASRSPVPSMKIVSGLPPHQSVRSVTACTTEAMSVLRYASSTRSHGPGVQGRRAEVRARARTSLAAPVNGAELAASSALISSRVSSSSGRAARNSSSARLMRAPGGTCTFVKRIATVCVTAASVVAASGRRHVSLSRGCVAGSVACAGVRSSRTFVAALT